MSVGPREEVGFNFGHRTRLVILLLSIACLTAVQSNVLAFNFTVICMDDIIPANYTGVHFLKSSTDLSYIFSSVAIGALAGTFPCTFFMRVLGPKWSVAMYGFVSAISTLIWPFVVANGGFATVLVVRALQGFGMAISFPAVGAIAAQWSSLKEVGTYVAFLTVHMQLASVLTMPVAGILCGSSLTWRALYYAQGVFSVVVFGLFVWYYTESPHIHRHVSSKELMKITRDKSDVSAREPVPYLPLCTDKRILAVWLSCIGGNLGFLVFLYYGPTYMNKVLHMDVNATGYLTALPFVLSACVKMAAGPMSDHASCLSEKARLVLFASASQATMAVSILFIAYTDSIIVAQVAYNVTIVFSGLNVVGVIKGAQMVSRQHVHFVLMVISCAANIIILLVPYVVAIICPDNTPEQWSRFFTAISAALIVCNIPFVFLASSEPAEWTKPREKKAKIFAVDEPTSYGTKNSQLT